MLGRIYDGVIVVIAVGIGVMSYCDRQDFKRELTNSRREYIQTLNKVVLPLQKIDMRLDRIETKLNSPE